MPSALVIGSSDGIGLALVRALLGRGFAVLGLSRSPLAPERLALAPELAAGYRHLVVDVRDPGYRDRVSEACDQLGVVDVCVYCAGVGVALDLDEPDEIAESEVFEVNLVGLVRTIEVVLPRMLAAARGHIIGLSSLADTFLNPGAP